MVIFVGHGNKSKGKKRNTYFRGRVVNGLNLEPHYSNWEVEVLTLIG